MPKINLTVVPTLWKICWYSHLGKYKTGKKITYNLKFDGDMENMIQDLKCKVIGQNVSTHKRTMFHSHL